MQWKPPASPPWRGRLLMQGLADALIGTPCRLLQARQLPPGDGGLSLGQVWVALQQWIDSPSEGS